jgi:hypothetical protein
MRIKRIAAKKVLKVSIIVAYSCFSGKSDFYRTTAIRSPDLPYTSGEYISSTCAGGR